MLFSDLITVHSQKHSNPINKIYGQIQSYLNIQVGATHAFQDLNNNKTIFSNMVTFYKIKKLMLSHYTPRRRLGGEEV
jgi:hypothetical protein